MAEVLPDVAGQPRPRKPVVALVAHGVHEHGGMERAGAELIRRGSDKVDFIVVAADLALELRPLVQRWVHVRVARRPIPLKFVLFWLFAGRALRRVDADLLHTVGAIVPNRVDIASIHFCHAGFLAANNSLAQTVAPFPRQANTALSRILALASERWSYRPSRLRAFAAVSRGVAAEVTRHYPSIPVTVTPNGVDVERFRPDPEARAALRSAEAVGDGVVALFVGGDWDRKGLGIAVEAISRVRADGHDLRLWVVGRGDEARVAALAEQFGVAPFIRFFGPRPDTERFYQAADLFVLPSAYETFSLVCFEAAGCGLPVVIPPISGAREIVGADEGGLLITRSSRSVADALLKLATDPELRARLGAEARRRASAYTWQRSVDSMMELYRELLAEREVER
ncbi:MAG: glycosyltransferase family 4 protein [Dermatophilaceae bacterium]